MSFPVRLAALLTVAGALAACDSSGPSSTGSQVQFNIATRAATAAAPVAGFASAPVSFADSTDTLVIDQVQMVVREVELKRTDATSDSTCTGEHDGCEELESGPFLLDLPLSTGATTVLTVPVTPGTYSELEFKVHAPSSDSGDAFLALHPDFAGVSIRVTGSWNGTPFTYEAGVRAKQELEIQPPLTVTDSSNADFTLFIDIGSWFRSAGKLIDPSTANAGGANEELVNSNIVRSFNAFEDENHNGCDDNSEGGDGHHDGGGDSGSDDHGGM